MSRRAIAFLPTLKRSLAALALVTAATACTAMPIPTITPVRPASPPPPITTPGAIVAADATATPAPHATAEAEQPPRTRRNEPAAPASFLEQHTTNLFDLSRLPVMENTVTTQFTSRNWTALEHFFDYFVDDGNFAGPHYGYIDESGARQPYRIVPGYDGSPEYEIVPRVPGPGYIARIWFAYQQHQSINNPKDMSQNEEWNNWGNLGAMGNIRFYFDDERTPRLAVGIKDIFVGKNPFPAPLAAFYASADGGDINYIPIPFQNSIRVTTTGRPRLMQIEVKRLAAPFNSNSAGGTLLASVPGSTTPNPVQSFTPLLSFTEQAALDQAAQAWQTCAAAQAADYKTFALSVPHNNSAEVDFNQPATISGLRIRVPRGMEDSVWLQIFWDGEPAPSLTAPLRALFGTAEQLLPYHALPLGTVTTDAEHIFYDNFPMPFQSARIVILNERAETLPVTVEAVTVETLAGTENARLHAFYGTKRMQRREDDGDNYTVIDVKGSGKYLGTIFSAWDLDRQALNGPLPQTWRFPYLESNLDVWIDGRLALPGTGIEDDFNASYYYVYAGYPGYNATYCLAGVTLLDYSTPKEPSSQYRFYLNDAPEFRDHLRVEVQHGNKGNNLSVTYSSTAFWYQMK
ncbi:MAG: DUF2961 domain-containing protein [Chloroflexota bacterium]|nr:DUF2961 domain-containing protein [Chloroflexota bacterium]